MVHPSPVLSPPAFDAAEPHEPITVLDAVELLDHANHLDLGEDHTSYNFASIDARLHPFIMRMLGPLHQKIHFSDDPVAISQQRRLCRKQLRVLLRAFGHSALITCCVPNREATPDTSDGEDELLLPPAQTGDAPASAG